MKKLIICLFVLGLTSAQVGFANEDLKKSDTSACSLSRKAKGQIGSDSESKGSTSEGSVKSL